MLFETSLTALKKGTFMPTDSEFFIGGWQLRSAIKTSKEGVALNTWGEEPIGYLIYTKEGVMSAQIMRRPRSQQYDKNITQEYLAYSGHYEIDEVNKIISHKVELSLCLGYIDTVRRRQYHFLNNNQLQLKALECVDADYKLLWERIN